MPILMVSDVVVVLGELLEQALAPSNASPARATRGRRRPLFPVLSKFASLRNPNAYQAWGLWCAPPTQRPVALREPSRSFVISPFTSLNGRWRRVRWVVGRRRQWRCRRFLLARLALPPGHGAVPDSDQPARRRQDDHQEDQPDDGL